jgi:two-component system chemotaxis response regulator CheY
MKFLVVDDSSTMRRIVINTLTKAGYSEFTEAGNGSEAVDQLTKQPVDCVITDWNMPVMNGLEFVRAMRAQRNHEERAGADGDDQRRQGRHPRSVEGRVNDYVIKPFTPDVIKAKVTAVMSK